MKNFEKALAEAVRIEHDEKNDNIYIVFKVIDENFKRQVKTNWTKDIEYQLLGKYLLPKED
jgi:hypothetical protein